MHPNGFSEKERSSDFCCSTIKKFKELRTPSIEGTPIAEGVRLSYLTLCIGALWVSETDLLSLNGGLARIADGVVSEARLEIRQLLYLR